MWNAQRASRALAAIALSLSCSFVAAAPWVYVANNQSGTVSIISTETDEVMFTVRVGGEPHEVAISPDGATAFVSNARDDTVAVLESSVVVARVRTQRFPHGVAVAPDGRRAYVTNFLADSITVIDTRSLRAVETVPDVGSRPRHISIAPDGRYAYVTAVGTSSLTVLDLGTHEVVARIPVPGAGDGVSVTPDGATIYVASRRGNEVHLLDARTLEHRRSLRAGLGPNRIAFSADGRLALVANLSSWNVTFVDPVAERDLQSLHVGGPAVNAVVTPDAKKAYATVFSANGVVAIDLRTRTLGKRIPTGRGPDGIAIAERPLGLALGSGRPGGRPAAPAGPRAPRP